MSERVTQRAACRYLGASTGKLRRYVREGMLERQSETLHGTVCIMYEKTQLDDIKQSLSAGSEWITRKEAINLLKCGETKYLTMVTNGLIREMIPDGAGTRVRLANRGDVERMVQHSNAWRDHNAVP